MGGDKIIVIITMLIFSLISCDFESQTNCANFYKCSRNNGNFRIPLFEPYEIISPDEGFTWMLTLPSQNKSIQFLEKVGAMDKFFVIYTPRDASFSSDHPEIWAVINTRTKEEYIFTDKKKYEELINKFGISGIKMLDIISVFKHFDKDKKLPEYWNG